MLSITSGAASKLTTSQFITRSAQKAFSSSANQAPALLQLFHENVCHRFSQPKEIVQYAYQKALAPNRERLLLKSDKWYLEKATHCALTTLSIEAMAVEFLFEKKVRCYEERSLPSPSELKKEFLKNELHFYRFILSKGIFDHVFSIIKFPTDTGSPHFLFYQSYWSSYTLPEFISSKSFKIHTLETIERDVLDPLLELAEHKGKWDEKHYSLYEKITLISLARLESDFRATSHQSTVTLRSFAKVV